MAIGILQNPEDYAPAYNEINYLVTSDKTAQANFKYVCDIYITGISTPAYHRIKVSQDPTTGYGVFDVHRILENFLTSDIDKTTYGFARNTNSYVKYQCKFGEEFGLSSSGTTVYADLTLATARFAYNGIFDFIDLQGYNDSTYLLSGNTSEFLTSLKSKRIRTAMQSWAHFMASANNTDRMVVVATSTSGGTTTTVVNNIYPAPATVDADKFMRVSTGPNNLNQISPVDIITGAQPIIPTDTASYTIKITSTGLNAKSETLTYTIDDACTKNDVFILHWLNKYGGFDSFAFIRANKQTASIQRTKYKKPTGAISGATFVYAKSDRQEINFDTRIKDKIEVLSDWITDAESVWLEELVTSPQVYLDDTTHGLIAINIIDTGYERKEVATSKAFNLKLTFEYSYVRSRQRW